MGALNLALYDLKRLLRRRAMVVMLIAVPLTAAAIRCALPDWYPGLVIAWSSPIVCIALTLSVIASRRAADSTSGLSDAIRSTPLSDTALVVSRLVFGAIVFAVQMAILGGIIAVRF